MKALYFLKFIAVFCAVLLTGCAGTSLTAGGMNRNGGALLSYQDNNGQYSSVQHGGGGGLRAAPCEPLRVPTLIAWAKGAEGADGEGTQYHKRKAEVSNDNGRVNCYSSESAGSQSRTIERRSPQGGARSTATGTDRYPAATVYEMR